MTNDGVTFAPEAHTETKEAHVRESFDAAVAAAFRDMHLEVEKDHGLLPVPDRVHVPEDASDALKRDAAPLNESAERVEAINAESRIANAERETLRAEVRSKIRAQLPRQASQETRESHVIEGDSVAMAARAAESIKARRVSLEKTRADRAAALAEKLSACDPKALQAELVAASKEQDGPAVVKASLAVLGIVL